MHSGHFLPLCGFAIFVPLWNSPDSQVSILMLISVFLHGCLYLPSPNPTGWEPCGLGHPLFYKCVFGKCLSFDVDD